MAQGSPSALGGLGQRWVGAIEGQLETLSPRDRRLLMGLVSALALGLSVGLWWFLAGVLEDRASRVRDAKNHLEAVYALQDEYVGAAARLQSQEARLKTHAATPVKAYVEKLASDHGLSDQLRSVNGRGNPEMVGNLEQSTFTIDLQKAELQALIELLVDMETGGYPVQVQEANFKSSGKPGEKKIDLRLEVVAIRLAEGEGT